MKSHQYYRPETLDQALQLAEQYGDKAGLLSGGTDLIVRIQKGHADPEAVIDLKRVSDIPDDVTESEEVVSIGARMVLADLVEHPTVRHHFPALVEAASVVGSVQIRNRATLAGNICNASPAADTVPPLMVHDAVVVLAGRAGTRRCPLREFFLGPGRTVRAHGEIVVAVEIPVPQPPFGAGFGRLTRRRGVDLATINMACGIDNRRVTTFVFGAAGPTPILARDESGVLADESATAQARTALLAKLVAMSSPISDVRSGKAYREAMLMTIGTRVLREATSRYYGDTHV